MSPCFRRTWWRCQRSSSSSIWCCSLPCFFIHTIFLGLPMNPIRIFWRRTKRRRGVSTQEWTSCRNSSIFRYFVDPGTFGAIVAAQTQQLIRVGSFYVLMGILGRSPTNRHVHTLIVAIADPRTILLHWNFVVNCFKLPDKTRSVVCSCNEASPAERETPDDALFILLRISRRILTRPVLLAS